MMFVNIFSIASVSRLNASLLDEISLLVNYSLQRTSCATYLLHTAAELCAELLVNFSTNSRSPQIFITRVSRV